MKAQLVSLFTGAGALDYGFSLSGKYEVIAAVESEQDFCQTLLVNQEQYLPCKRVFQTDIREINSNILFKEKTKRGPIGVIGGPPCEAFSKMGKIKKKMQGLLDERGLLVFDFARIAANEAVDFFVMENVPNLVSIDKGKAFDSLMNKFTCAGFSTHHAILNAANYGAATLRKRLFVVGLRENVEFKFPEPTHFEYETLDLSLGQRWISVGEAIGDLPDPSINQPGNPQGHVRIKHTPAVIERFANLKQGTQDNIRRRAKLSWDRPSTSLVAGNLKGIRSHIHPLEPRELTNRESARIQGFPDDYVFCGSPAAVGKQIANAVPVQLARAVASQLAKTLNL